MSTIDQGGNAFIPIGDRLFNDAQLDRGDPGEHSANGIRILTGSFEKFIYGLFHQTFNIEIDGKLVILNKNSLDNFLSRNGYKKHPDTTLASRFGEYLDGHNNALDKYFKLNNKTITVCNPSSTVGNTSQKVAQTGRDLLLQSNPISQKMPVVESPTGNQHMDSDMVTELESHEADLSEGRETERPSASTVSPTAKEDANSIELEVYQDHSRPKYKEIISKLLQEPFSTKVVISPLKTKDYQDVFDILEDHNSSLPFKILQFQLPANNRSLREKYEIFEYAMLKLVPSPKSNSLRQYLLLEILKPNQPYSEVEKKEFLAFLQEELHIAGQHQQQKKIDCLYAMQEMVNHFPQILSASATE